MSRYLVWLLGGGTVVVAGAVTLWLTTGMRDAPPPAGVAAPAAGRADAAPQLAAAGASRDGAAQADPAPPPPPALDPPAFDVVRVARDGSALVAGSAAPGAAITLRVDGAVVAEVAADGAGQFVALFTLAAGDAPQVLTLEMQDAAGRSVLSADTVILTPRAADPAMPAAGAAGGDAPAMTVAALDTAPGDAAPAGPAAGDADSAAVPETGPVAASAAEPQPDVAPESGTALARAGGEPGPGPVRLAAATPAESSGEAQPEETARDGTQAGAAEPVTLAASEAATAGNGAPAAAEDLPTAFLLRGDGQVEVMGRAPRVMDNVVIDTISYSDAGDVQISGRAAQAEGSADLRIYLDNRPIAVAQAEGGDWRLDLPAIDPGVYLLRVDQLNPAGRVVSRFETPFQRETPERVAAAQAAARGPAAGGPSVMSEAPAGAEEPASSMAETGGLRGGAGDAPADPVAGRTGDPAPGRDPLALAAVQDIPAAVSPVAAAEQDGNAPVVAQGGGDPAGAGQAEGTRQAPVARTLAAAGNATAETGPVSPAAPDDTASGEAGGDGNESVARVAAGDLPAATTAAATTSVAAGAETPAGAGAPGAATPPTTDEATADERAVAAQGSAPDESAGAPVPVPDRPTARPTAHPTAGATVASADPAPADLAPADPAPVADSASAAPASAAQAARAPGDAPALPGADPEDETSPTPRVSLITVQPGHTLWHISQQRYGAGARYVIIYRANRSQIRDPDLIYPGQIFTLPDE